MKYKLFYTDLDMPEAQYRANKPFLFRYLYDELDDALGMAREINARGSVAWEIVSTEGTVIGRREIARIVQERAAELTDRPRVR